MNVAEIKRINCYAWNIEFNKKINIQIASENLKTVSNFLNEGNRDNYCVFFGTLLGFIREGDFIEHDEDTDIVLINPSNFFLLEFKKKLIEWDFYIFRDDTFLFSVMKKGEYIDFYKFYKFNNKYQSGSFIFDRNILEKLNFIRIKEKFDIKIPNNPKEVLEILYGKSWKVSLEDHHADPLFKQKNNRLNYKLNLLLYRFYSKIKKHNTLFGILMRSNLIRFIIKIYNKLFDFIFGKNQF